VFESFNYDGKLDYCDRREQIDGPSEEAWAAINAHLGMKPSDLPGLVRELGQLRLGHIPRVGDAFCGGGSVPFEAARLGCEAYGSDLNPVAAAHLGALHIVGGGPQVAEEVRRAQAEVYAAVDRQVMEWGIEHNEDGWRADAFLYCTETLCPSAAGVWAPSWVIGEKTRTIGSHVPDPANRLFEIAIHQGVSTADLLAARQGGTTRDARLHCPNCPCSNSCASASTTGTKGYGRRL
jgi:putative DNA methylase